MSVRHTHTHALPESRITCHFASGATEHTFSSRSRASCADHSSPVAARCGPAFFADPNVIAIAEVSASFPWWSYRSCPTPVRRECQSRNSRCYPGRVWSLEAVEAYSVGRMYSRTLANRTIINAIVTSVLWLNGGRTARSHEFEQFIARHFGVEGRAWLDRLPERVEFYRRTWFLDIERFLPGGLLSCCLAVTTREGEAVLKLCGPWTPSVSEGTALRAWNGGPSPKLLRIDPEGNALLLERVRPATPFLTPDSPDTLGQLAALIKTLHAPPLTPDLYDRLPPLGNVVDDLINTAGAEAAARSVAEAAELRPRLELARRQVRSLLADPQPPTLLHGDWKARTSSTATGVDSPRSIPCPVSATLRTTRGTGLRPQSKRNSTRSSRTNSPRRSTSTPCASAPGPPSPHFKPDSAARRYLRT